MCLPADDMYDSLAAECEKLKASMRALERPGRLSADEIVSCYFHVMSVLSHIEAARRAGARADAPPGIGEADSVVSEFNRTLHPRILERLDASIRGLTDKLGSDGAQTAGEIESRAGLYDELRRHMSTREFAGQYDKGLA